MYSPPGRAERYSASASWYRHSPARPHAMCSRASCGFLQRGLPAHRRRELALDLRPRLQWLAGSKAVQHLAETFLGQILVGILPDQDHRRVHAGAETLDFFPAEIAILGQMKGIVMDAALAHLDDLAGAAQPARRGAADLNVRLLADRLQLEHRVEGRNLQRPDIGHVEQIRDRTDRRFGNPAVMLFLQPPQDRYHRGGLPAFRIFGDLSSRPSEIFRRE